MSPRRRSPEPKNPQAPSRTRKPRKDKKTLEELKAAGSARASTRRTELKQQHLVRRRKSIEGRKRPGPRSILKPSRHAEILRDSVGYDPLVGSDGFVFDEKAARAAVRFFHEQLVLVEGEWAGQSFRLERWQQAIVMALFGWQRKDGTRRYRESLIYLPRKNSKTTLSAGLSLLSFFADNEPGAQVYCAAAERKQAGLLWRIAQQQILLNEDLEARCDVGAHAITLLDDPLSSFQALSAEAGTKHGMNPHCVVLDELHVQKDDKLYEAFRTGMGSRRQPLLVMITTARWWDPEHICNRVYDHACKVRDGVIEDPSFLPVIYEAALDDDWTDPDVWERANPNYGISVKREFLEQECAKAQSRPAEVDSFRRLYLNIRTNAETAWIRVEHWDGLDGEALEEGPCYGGLDLGKVHDHTAFALYWPQTHALRVWYWMPRDTAMEQEVSDRVPYASWMRGGFMEGTPGNVCDYTHVEQRILQECEGRDVVEVGFDPYSAHQMSQRLADAGLTMVEFRQGFLSMSEPSKEFERLVVSGLLRPAASPVLRWNVSNVMVRKDPAGNIKPDKSKSAAHIDGVVASIMAIGRAIHAEQPAEWTAEVFAS